MKYRNRTHSEKDSDADFDFDAYLEEQAQGGSESEFDYKPEPEKGQLKRNIIALLIFGIVSVLWFSNDLPGTFFGSDQDDSRELTFETDDFSVPQIAPHLPRIFLKVIFLNIFRS
ncbi:MAG: hypothetical protein FH748_09520 [Balneolaceae bacterium]|nr:hypothetical protein [Balneolaceae bacterium]